MIEPEVHKFDGPDWGYFDLEIDGSTRQFHRFTSPNDLSFKVKTYGQPARRDQPFFFYEWQKIQYTYVVKDNSLFTAPFELRVNNRTINRSGKKGDSHILSGHFSFNDGVGETNIELRDQANTLIFSLRTEVFPQKMDYKSDYKALMADITSIIHNLAHDSLKDTFRRSRAKLTGQATRHEWWNILDALFESLVASLNVIKTQSKHEIINSEKVLPVEKIRNASKKNIDWLRKNTRYAGHHATGLSVLPGKSYSHALSAKKQVTYDTYENRFVAWALRNTVEQLRQYKKHIESYAGQYDYSPLVNKIGFYQGKLQGLLRENPFNEAGSFEKRAHFSTSLTRGAGYRDFMHIYLLLSRGLELVNNDIFKIEQKNISLLYEYWCFLKLVQILKEQNASEISYQDLIKVRANKFRVELQKGIESKVVFKKANVGESTTAYFNREFKVDDRKAFTYNQRPDYTIEFKRKGFEKPFWYLFDAKYRFDESDQEAKGVFNAPKDAIGQLHRYRDAILHTEPEEATYRRVIKNLGGIILYPYPLSEKEFEDNLFYKSIKDVNIGALPFLPGKTALASDLLNYMINKATPEEHFERFIEMDHSEYTKRRNAWKEWITIGVVQKKEQAERLKFIADTGIFHVPFVRELNSKLYLSKKLLVCKAGTNEATLYEIRDWEMVTDKELYKKGARWDHRTNKYLAFHLKKAKHITTPDKIAPYKFRYTTQESLNGYLQNPETNKDYFYLTTPDAARLYEELKKAGISFKVKWGDKESDPSLLEFECGKNLSLFSSETYHDLHYKHHHDGEELPLTEALRQAAKLQ